VVGGPDALQHALEVLRLSRCCHDEEGEAGGREGVGSGGRGGEGGGGGGLETRAQEREVNAAQEKTGPEGEESRLRHC
jgi:hypothetical protein